MIKFIYIKVLKSLLKNYKNYKMTGKQKSQIEGLLNKLYTN